MFILLVGMNGKGASLSKSDIDDILKFGTEELFKEDSEVNQDGESADDIVYDDKAVAALLDRSQGGIEEKECWANEYLSSFKVRYFFYENIFTLKFFSLWWGTPHCWGHLVLVQPLPTIHTSH